MDEICQCYYDILLLNPNKIHSNKVISKSSKRILGIIHNNAVEFEEEAIIVAQKAAKVISTRSVPSTHNCESVKQAVKLIKKKLTNQRLLAIQKGTKSSTALVPYYPQDKFNPMDTDSQKGDQADPSSSDTEMISNLSEESMEIDYENSHEMDIDEGKESAVITNIRKRKEQDLIRTSKGHITKRAKCDTSDKSDMELKRGKPSYNGDKIMAGGNGKGDLDKNIDQMVKTWVRENRNDITTDIDDTIKGIIGHWYKFEKPKFKCTWDKRGLDTIETTDTLIKKLRHNTEPLNTYLKSINQRAFETLVNRAPELIIAIFENKNNQRGTV